MSRNEPASDMESVRIGGDINNKQTKSYCITPHLEILDTKVSGIFF